MSVRIKRITLWRRDVDNEPGALGSTLEPLAARGADLEIVMGYAYPGDSSRAAIEVYPVSGRKTKAAAERAGLHPSETPTLLVEGKNVPGLGFALARALGESGINISFLVTQVIGKRYVSVFGFKTEGEAKRAATILENTSKRKR